MSIKRNSKFRPFVERVMPAVYDDSLTYYEMLSKVVAYLNQMNDQANEVIEFMDSAIDTQNKNIVDTQTEFIKVRDFLNYAYETFKAEIEHDVMPVNLETVLDRWFDSGRLAEIINNDVFDMKADKSDLRDLGYNVRWNALMVQNGDWTQAIQHALDNYTHVIIPRGIRKIGQLTVSRFGAKISSPSQLYSPATLEYDGDIGCLKILPSVNYLTLENIHLKGKPVEPTDFYNSSSIGVDMTNPISIFMYDCWLEGFETLVKSNYNSYYNKFRNSRFERAKSCLFGFSDNNLDSTGCRFRYFHEAFVTNGTNGPQVITKCSFEIFNGAIVRRVGLEKGLVTFRDNYVEIYDKFDLPTNFPTANGLGALPNKYGGNILFAGTFGNLIITENEMQLGGVFRVVSSNDIDYLESKGNNVHIYATNNNLDRMFFVPSLKTYYINDRLGVTIGADGGYSRTYSQSPLNVSNVYNNHYFFDCILNKELISPQKVFTPTLENGWTGATDVSHGNPKVFVAKEGLYLQGAINGTNRTDINIFTLPENVRPFAHGTSRGFCNFTAFASLGAGEQVRLRYLYASGVLRLEGTPESTVNIVLDGLFIPLRV